MLETRDKTCCLTGRRLPGAGMLRLVSSPEGLLVPDFQHRLSDCAIWIEASRSLIQEAIRDDRFWEPVGEGLGRSLQQENGAEFTNRIDDFLLSRCLGRLGLARKAGQFVTGFERVCQMTGLVNCPVFFLAGDAGENARQKFRKIPDANPGRNVIEILSGPELGSVVGRERVVYGAMTKGFAGQAFYDEVLRLGRFRGKAVPCAAPESKKTAAGAGKLAQNNSGAEA